MASACRLLAMMVVNGFGVDKDLAKGATLLSHACDKGDPWACAAAAMRLRDGMGVSRDLDAAKELFAWACERKVAYACTELGILLRSVGTPGKPEDDGSILVERGCKLGDSFACSVVEQVKKERRGLSEPLPNRSGCLGTEAKEAITAAMTTIHKDVQACYEEALKLHATLEGKVISRFAIEGTGAILFVEIASATLSDEKVKQCVLDHVGSLHFPPCQGAGVAVVSYPWIFKLASDTRK